MVSRLLAVFCLYQLMTGGESAGAGRAFPLDSENFAIKLFQGINPSIKWDHTNFLIDLSGQYANCDNQYKKGEMKADRKSPEGDEITIIIDTIEGKDSDVDKVNQYLTELLKRWEANGQYHGQIRNNKRVGCSVRPACGNIAVVACVFSTGDGKGGRGDGWGDGTGGRGDGTGGRGHGTGGLGDGGRGDGWGDGTGGRGDGTWGGGAGDGQYQHGRGTSWDQGQELKASELGFIEEEDPKALAFTPEEYKLAESIMGKTWEHTHFLENLSGFETDCDMVGKADWPFDYKKKIEREVNLKITGQYGSTENKGSTPDAMKVIMSKFKPVPNSHSLGCSVIPHCRHAGTMHVVVACLYEEN